METSIYITIFSTLAGAFVGGLIAEARNILQLRRDVNRARNNLLYNLLDIWFIIKTRDVDVFIDDLIDRLSLKANVPKNMIIDGFEKNIDFKSTLVKIILEKIPTEHLEKKYQEAVDSLGPLDPLLAYRMSGKGSLIRYEDISATFKKHMFEDKTPENASFDRFMKHLKEFADKKVAQEVLNLIEEDIRKVGERIGGRTRRGVEETFRRLEVRAKEDRIKFLDEYIDHILTFKPGG